MAKTATEIIAYYEGTIDLLVNRSKGKLPSYISADDLKMEIKMELLLKLGRYDPTLASLDTYVSRVIEYKILNYLKEIGRSHELLDDSKPSPWDDYHTHDSKIGIDVVKGDYKALAQSLSSNDMEYTIMVLLAEGNTQTEIAEQLGLSQPTISRYIGNIRDNLSIELK